MYKLLDNMRYQYKAYVQGLSYLYSHPMIKVEWFKQHHSIMSIHQCQHYINKGLISTSCYVHIIPLQSILFDNLLP